MARAKPQEIQVGDLYEAQRGLDLVSSLQETFAPRDRLYRELDEIIYLKRKPYVPKNYRKTTVSVRSPMALHMVNSVTAALSVNSPVVGYDPIGLGDEPVENAQLRQAFFAASWRRQEEEAGRQTFRRFMHSLVGKGAAVVKTMERTKTAWASYDKYLKSLTNEMKDPKGPYAGWSTNEKDKYYDLSSEEFKRGQAYPIVSTDIPPESFYYVQGEGGFSTCVEVKMVPFYSTLVKYKAAMGADGSVVSAAVGQPESEWGRVMRGEQMLKLVEIWDWDTVSYILQGPGNIGFSDKHTNKTPTGQLVRVFRHGYGNKDTKTLRGPYFHTFGITTSSRDPALEGLSILFGYLDLFPLLDSLMTIQSNSAFMTGFAAYKRKLPPQSIISSAAVMDDTDGVDGLQQERIGEAEPLIPGEIYPYDLEPINQPRSGADLGAMVGLVRSMLEMALPTAATGQISGDTTGYALNQAQHLASLAWDPIVKGAEACWSARTSFESWLIENRINETVSVWGDSADRRIGKKQVSKAEAGWLTIGPKDLHGIHRYKVELKPETPSNEVIEIRKHQQLIAMRAETPAMMRAALGFDPLEVEKGWMLEDIKNDPHVQEVFKQRVWQALGTIDKRNLGGVTPPAGPPSGAAQQPIQIPQGAMVPGMTQAPSIALQGGPAPGAAPTAAPSPQQAQLHPGQPPGTVSGQPGGVRNLPGAHQPVPGLG